MSGELYNRISGCILGHALGDALGAPCEFRPYAYYSGKLDSPIIKISQYQGKKISVIGQITDDAEMAMALLYSLEDGWDRDKTIREYMIWANNREFTGNQPFMGKNTRNLFIINKNSEFKISLYDARYKKSYSTKESRENSQSNGALMRAYPLAFVNDDVAPLDAEITNPSSVSIQAVEVYTKAIKNALRGMDKKQIIQEADKDITIHELRIAFNQAIQGKFRNVTQNRGWIVHAFLLCFLGVYTV